MFGLGALILIGVFVASLLLVSKLLTAGKWRVAFVLAIFGSIAGYPFLYQELPSYRQFLAFCQQSDREVILKKRPVDFIFLEWGFASDCTSGPKFIEDHGYLGFDCLKRDERGTALYRFTKRESWHKGCALECFEQHALATPEARYESGYRYGYVQDGKRVVTYDGGSRNAEKSDPDFFFTDKLLIGESEMAFTTDYAYFPYGTTWGKILGMASGSAPSKVCKVNHLRTDPRIVFPSRTGGS